MMEALGENVGMAPAAVESLISEKMVVKALREMLPSLDADTVTIGIVMEKLALRFGTDKQDIKTRWRARLKEILPDMLDLCAGGGKDGDEKKEEDEDEEEEEFRPTRKRPTRKRNAVSDSEDEEEDANDSDASETKADEPEDDEEEEFATVKRRRPSSGDSRKQTSKPAAKKAKTTKQADTPGIASLKELGRAAGVLNPHVYGLLKAASSAEEEEEILRDRLRDAGVIFTGSYPSSRDISVAKRKHEKAKELEGIDTRLIISGGRSRRNSGPRISYKEDYEGKDAVEEEEDDDEDDEDASDREADDSGSDSAGTF
ncbi:hypothetical protein PHYBOEH_006412 [Phytophthora boehmeriae]|uniref:Uncharacterized protein n=1 Tax=Phytophthora boehmeriae TaxID=109152 RepID=A0A8T1X2V5_9STRA|nr:hypothetical protein PHYBOEH_006412 [Phytophthora boehmeriae]